MHKQLLISYLITMHAMSVFAMLTQDSKIRKSKDVQGITYETEMTPDKTEGLSCTKKRDGSISCWGKYITILGKHVAHQVVSSQKCAEYYKELAKRYKAQKQSSNQAGASTNAADLSLSK